jgi:hypothetical protein
MEALPEVAQSNDGCSSIRGWTAFLIEDMEAARRSIRQRNLGSKRPGIVPAGWPVFRPVL